MKSSEKNSGNTKNFGKTEKLLKLYEHLVRMEDKRWPKRLMTW